MIKKIIYLLMLCNVAPLFSQKEGANWYFGVEAGLDFNPGVPVALTNGQLNQLEGCAAISNNQGNLLFYTDGQVIYNSNHVLMQNGTGLLGDQSSSQSAIIVPVPGDSTKYYVFTVYKEGLPQGLSYSIVDMTLDGGLGGVVPTQKNIQLATSVAEKITAVYDASQASIWVITHSMVTNEFLAYKITSSGISTTPIVSPVGTGEMPRAGGTYGYFGYLKVSPDGTKLACANTSGGLGVYLCDFNTSTGTVSNTKKVENTFVYGVEFSPDSKLLYFTTTFSGWGGSLNQCDATLPNLADILASKIVIDSNLKYMALQLGIDGKIYVAQYSFLIRDYTTLTVINNPNERGTACNLEVDSIDLAARQSQSGLPQFIQSYFIQEIEAAQFCATSPTTFKIRSGIDPLTATWTFGDGATSTALEPNHTYATPGTYTVSVNFTTAAGDDVIHLEKEVTILAAPTATAPPDLRTCDALPNDGRATFNLASQNATILGTQNPNNYTVAYYANMDDAIAAQRQLPTTYTSTTTPQPIYARVTGANGCYAITDFDFIVTPVPTANTPDNLAECEATAGGGTATFNLTRANSQITGGSTGLGVTYYKNLSHLQQGIAITTPTQYTNTTPYSETVHFKVTNITSPDCTATGTLGLTVNPLPVLNHNIAPYRKCDSNNPGDGIEAFDLTTMQGAITNEAGLTLNYAYEQNGTTIPITNPRAFTNTTPGGQTIYVTTQNTFTCGNTTSFTIVVGPLPIANQNLTFRACEEAPGQGLFDLNAMGTQISGTPGATVTYYLTRGEATQGGAGALASPYLSGNRTLYARVATPGGCAATAPLTLEVAPAPIAPDPAPLQQCDDNNDNTAGFNLDSTLQQLAAALGTVTVTVHETREDADFGTNAITNTGSYSNVQARTTNGVQTLYIRVAAGTGQATCYDVVALQLVVRPRPEATTPQPYTLCDDTTDGQATFNLTTKDAEVLGDLDPALYTVAYYEVNPETAPGANPIANPVGYNSTSKIIFVKVTDNATGCYDVVPMQLIVSPLPQATQPVPYTLCDTNNPGDEREVFDLSTKTAEIIGTQEGLVLSYYHSYADAQNNTGAITNPTNYTNSRTVETLFVVVTVEATGCKRIVLLDVRVEPLPILTAPAAEDRTVCDPDGNGFAEFNLLDLVPDMINNGRDITVTFYGTFQDAQSGFHPIVNPQNYVNEDPFFQTIWIVAENTVTGCQNTEAFSIDLIIVPSPQLPDLGPLSQCDEDANNQDGRTRFDLTQQNAVIYAAPGIGANYVIHYFTTPRGAEDDAPRITNDTSYLGRDGEVIWVRVEDPATECYGVTRFELNVGTPLLLTTPSTYTVCNAELPNDTVETFDLTTKDNEILGVNGVGQGFTVQYYVTQADALANTGAIANTESYQNVRNAQTLFVAVTTTDGCRSYTTLTLRVLPLPTPDTTPDALVVCDVEGTTGTESFDLTSAEADIRNNDNTTTVTYHLTAEDANQDINAIADPANFESGNATVYVRVEANTNNPADPKCYQVVALQLIVNPLPVLGNAGVIPPFAHCEQNTDGIDIFILAEHNSKVLQGQDPAGYRIRYYLTPANAEAGTPALPNEYPNEQPGEQEIYVRVDDTTTGCRAIGSFRLLVEESAIANAPQNTDFITCDTDGTNDGIYTFNLTTVEAEVLGTQDPATYSIAYYESEADAEAGENAIATPQAYNNTASPDMAILWIRVTNTTTISLCHDVTSIELQVERLPEPVINTGDAGNTVCLEYGTNNILRDLTLNSGITEPGYTFSWYRNGTLIAGATAETYTATAAGDYTVTATSPQGCTSGQSAAFTVTASGPAVAIANGYSVSNYFSGTQAVTVNVQGNGTYQYRLDDGPWQASNVFTNVTSGTHTVTVRDITAVNPCDDLIISGVSLVGYPKYFTPNGDGYHDYWNITGLDTQENADAKLYIFDRYGKLIKQISPQGEGWDGTYNGRSLPGDDYWFTVTYTETINRVAVQKEFRAHFALKR